MKWGEGRVKLIRKEVKHSPARPLVMVGLGIFLITTLVALSLIHGWIGEPQLHTLLILGWVVDEQTGEPVVASIFLDGRKVLEGVTSFELKVPSGSEIRVEAEGYHPWGIRFRYKVGEDKILKGPIRLKRRE